MSVWRVSTPSSPFSTTFIALFSFCILFPNVFNFFGEAAESISNEGRDIRIFNYAGVKIELYWIDPNTREDHLMTLPGVGLYHGAQMPLQSFVGHEFEVREVPSMKTGRCEGGQMTNKSSMNENSDNNENTINDQCRIGSFTVTVYDNQGKLREINQNTHNNIELNIFY
jgi:hypothetical protein